MCVIDSGIGPMLQAPDVNAFREFNRQKPKGLIDKRMSEREAVERYWARVESGELPPIKAADIFFQPGL